MTTDENDSSLHSSCRPSHRAHRDKIALVLAGGGITGAVYEIGALRAIDDLLVDLSVNDFDIYVGTSAGALVGSLMANGFTPHEIMQIIDNRHPELRGVRVGDVFNMNMEGIWRRLRSVPRTFFGITYRSLTRWREVALSDVVWELAELLPSGIYNGSALEYYIRAALQEYGRTNRFDELKKELHVVATELDSGERAVFGSDSRADVPISMAIAASSAVPVLYRPVEIDGCDYVDGGLHGAASLDLAIEAGAKLIVCINPMVPLDTSKVRPGKHSIRKHGLQAIVNQSVRTLLHSTVRYHVKNLRAKHPDVDIVLIQPHWDDYDMFCYSLMSYRSRLVVAEHGFESVSRAVLQNFKYFDRVLARHHIEITRGRIREELDQLESSHKAPEVMEKIIRGYEEVYVQEPAATEPSQVDAPTNSDITLGRLDAAANAG